MYRKSFEDSSDPGGGHSVRRQFPKLGTRVTRRQMVRGAGAAALTGVTWATAGCGSGTSDDTTTVPGSPSASQPSGTPVAGGTLTVGQVVDLNLKSGFPLTQTPQTSVLLAGVLEQLIRYRTNLEPEPLLAERFEYSADRTVLTVGLRPDAKFHNGQAVTPEDVFFAIDLSTNPAALGLTGLTASPFGKAIGEKKRLDDQTLEIHFVGAAPVNMNDYFTDLFITPRATFGKLQSGTEIQGTGPYKFVSWQPNQGFRLERNSEWWGRTTYGGPFFDAVQGTIFGDQDSLGLAFEKGSVDFAITNPTVAARYRDRASVGHKTGLTYIAAVVTNPLLHDRRVREALFLALDRERFVNELQERFGTVTVQSWPETSPAFDASYEAAYYDVKKAKDLLGEAGFTQDKPLLLEYGTGTLDAWVTVAKNNWKDIGIEVELKPSDPNAYVDRLISRGFSDLFIGTHQKADLSPITNLEQTTIYRQQNNSFYESQEYTGIVTALERLDPLSADAKAQYKLFNELFIRDAWVFPLAPTIPVNLASPSLRGIEYTVTPHNVLNLGTLWKTTE